MAQQYEHQPELAGELTVNDFTKKGRTIVLIFEDSSFCSFKYAFYKHEKGFVVVYTEHCGYHCFDENTIKSIEQV